ncbi:MAG: DUF1538 domain-containing protein [Oscillospiraceae bacterium]|nr:DUF1538 domain-containing protein [Oscillospiraceae bacterium]
MNKKLKEKIHESFSSVMPITLIVLLLSTTAAPMTLETLLLFLTGAVLLVVGMGFFTLGADIAMMPIGQQAGEHLTRTKKLWLIVLSCFVVGIFITVAEPDLQVLARQTPAVPDMVLILTVAVGVGLFLVLAFLRILFCWRLSHLLLLFYMVVFSLAFFVPDSFLAVAFDSGGVTTGPITVPFIMALGLGLTSVRGDHGAEDDSFGLVALCSIGPILSVLILGLLYNPSGSGYTPLQIPALASTKELFLEFGRAIPAYALEVALALIPIFLLFLLLQVFFLKLRRRQLIKILIGLLYTFVGLTLFLTGVNVGFMPAGYDLGGQIAGLAYNWILIPLAMVIGFYIVKAEPAVLVLNKQVENITGGAISQRAMMTSLSIGMAISLGLSMVRVLTGLSALWFLIPGYGIALGLSFATPRIFTAIAFDSGGVASGPMTATFLLPFAMGACDAVGGNILTDAFGIVAMVAMTPLITIQLLGLLYRLKTRGHPPAEPEKIAIAEDEIIDFRQEEPENV